MKKQIAGALAVLGWSFLASACGLISGVSDDYTFERADAADASATPDGALLVDATTSDARVGDAGPDGPAVCSGAIPLADGVSPKCHGCFVANCCAETTRCADTAQATTRCNDYMKCLGGCKPPEAACRTTCQTKFGGALNQLAACRSGDCAALACAAPP
jgi:hypothetical protein